MKIQTSAKKLKVTCVLDAAPFANLRVVDNAPARSELVVNVGGRLLVADIATKSLRKAAKTVAEHGTENAVVLVQGTLSVGNRVEECGLTVNVKTPAADFAKVRDNVAS